MVAFRGGNVALTEVAGNLLGGAGQFSGCLNTVKTASWGKILWPGRDLSPGGCTASSTFFSSCGRARSDCCFAISAIFSTKVSLELFFGISLLWFFGRGRGCKEGVKKSGVGGCTFSLELPTNAFKFRSPAGESKTRLPDGAYFTAFAFCCAIFWMMYGRLFFSSSVGLMTGMKTPVPSTLTVRA